MDSKNAENTPLQPSKKKQNNKKITISRPAIVALVYAAFGVTWILTTDRLAEWLIRNEETLLVVQTIKGILYIVVTTTLVYWLAVRIVDSMEREILEFELTRSKQFTEDILENMGEGFQIIGFDWRYKYLNKTAVIHSRFVKERLIGQKIVEVYPGIENTELFTLLQETMEKRRPHQFENEFIYPDGQKRIFLINIQPVDEGVSVLSIDITDHKIAQTALRVSEEKNRAILASLGEAVFLMDPPTHTVLHCNPAVEDLFGYTQNELTGRTTEILHLSSQHYKNFLLMSDPALKEQGEFRTEYQLKRKDGRIVYAEIIGTVLSEELGWQGGLVSIMHDITAQKQAETDLRKSEARFRSLVTATAQVIWTTDPLGKVVEDIPSWRRFTGQSYEEVLGYKWVEALHPDDRQKTLETWESSVEKREIFMYEYRVRRYDGQYFYFSVRGIPFMDKEGNILEWIGSGTDITERKFAEEALRRSEEQYRLLAENSLDVIWAMNMDFLFTYVNPAIERHTGHTPREFQGTYLYEHCSEEDFTKALQAAMKLMTEANTTNRIRLEMDFFRKDKSVIPVEVLAKIIFDENNNPLGMQGVTRDISERRLAKQQQDTLLKQKTSLRQIDQLIISLSPMDKGLQQVLQEALNNLDVDAVNILVLDEQKTFLINKAHLGYSTSFNGEMKIPLQNSIAGRSALLNKTISMKDVLTKDSPFLRSDMVKKESLRGYACSPMIAKGNILGVLEVFSKKTQELQSEQLEFLEILAEQAALVIDNATTFRDLQISNKKLIEAYDANIQGWSRALDYRDRETEGHSQRVTEITLALARKAGISDEAELRYIRWGALLHDIGKMGVPDRILLKNGPLTDEEWEIMKRHPIIARDLLRQIEYLKPSIDIPYCHHEHWDGKGYPQGLSGEDIPLAARIFSIADVWDALRSDRPYRKKWEKEKIINHMLSISGTYLDSEITRVFLDCLSEISPCDS